MKRLRHLLIRLCGCALLVLAPASLQAQESLAIGDAVGIDLQPLAVSITMTNSAPVAGYILAIAYDTSLLTATAVGIEGTIAEDVGAEGVYPDIFDIQGGMTLGVFLDIAPPFAGQTIPPGGGQLIAQAQMLPDVLIAESVSSALVLTDGVFNNPPLDNTVILEGGIEIGAAQGLVLIHGSVTIEPPFPSELRILEASLPPLEPGSVQVLMSNATGPVEAFSIAIGHPAELELEEIHIAGTVTETAGAELVIPGIHPGGGTLVVEVDAAQPFDGQTIPVGVDQPIASFVYVCPDPPVLPEPPLVLPLTFQDGVLGDPPIANVIVVSGVQLAPTLLDGTITCEPVEPVNTVYYCGTDDGLGGVANPEGLPGSVVAVSFYFSDPDSPIMGFQVAACFDCGLTFLEDTFSIAGTVIEGAGAEFLTWNVDNDAADGDGCELLIGILLDALPPFEGQTVPPAVEPQRIGAFDAHIADDALPGSLLAVEFCDGINGTGSVPVGNVVVIDFEGFTYFDRIPCDIVVLDGTPFVRGDCNDDGGYDVGDAIALLMHLFGGGAVPLCRAACEVNGDGLVDVADAIYALANLFGGGPSPPLPHPECGNDPDADCEAFASCP